MAEKRTSEERLPANRRGFLRSSSLLLAGAVPHTVEAASTTTHRIGLIGDDKHAVKASEALLREHPAAKLTAIASPFPDVLQQMFRSLKGSTPNQVDVHPDQRFQGTSASLKLLDSKTVDHVVIAGPPSFRADIAHKALHRGLQTTVLAPFATDLNQLSSFDVARQLGPSVVPAMSWPANVQQRMQALATGALGHIESIQVICRSHSDPKIRAHRDWSPYEASLRNWHAETCLSGGAFLRDTINTFHLLLSLASAAERSSNHPITPEPIRSSETAAVRISSVSGESDAWLRSSLLLSGGIDVDFSWRGSESGHPAGPGLEIIVTGERGSCDLCSKKKNKLDMPRSNLAPVKSHTPSPPNSDTTGQTIAATRRVGATHHPALGVPHNLESATLNQHNSPFPAHSSQPALNASSDRHQQSALATWLEAHRLALSLRDSITKS